MLSKEWKVEYILAGNSANSRGVAINNSIEYTWKSCVKDPEGRYVIMEIDIVNLVEFTIIINMSQIKTILHGSRSYSLKLTRWPVQMRYW